MYYCEGDKEYKKTKERKEETSIGGLEGILILNKMS